MFAVGHLALAYLLGKGSAKPLKVNPSVPVLLVLSILPDVDILAGVEGFHRGPTHSLIVALLVFIPFFIIYRKKAFPYFLALASHGTIGDLIIGGNVQLFWPITTSSISLYPVIPKISILSPVNVALETTLFIVATLLMFKSKDLESFFQNKKANLLLAIPIATVLLPTFISYPLTVPIVLVVPHVFYLVLFAVSVLTVIFLSLKTLRKPSYSVPKGG